MSKSVQSVEKSFLRQQNIFTDKRTKKETRAYIGNVKPVGKTTQKSGTTARK